MVGAPVCVASRCLPTIFIFQTAHLPSFASGRRGNFANGCCGCHVVLVLSLSWCGIHTEQQEAYEKDLGDSYAFLEATPLEWCSVKVLGHTSVPPFSMAISPIHLDCRSSFSCLSNSCSAVHFSRSPATSDQWPWEVLQRTLLLSPPERQKTHTPEIPAEIFEEIDQLCGALSLKTSPSSRNSKCDLIVCHTASSLPFLITHNHLVIPMRNQIPEILCNIVDIYWLPEI